MEAPEPSTVGIYAAGSRPTGECSEPCQRVLPEPSQRHHASDIIVARPVVADRPRQRGVYQCLGNRFCLGAAREKNVVRERERHLPKGSGLMVKSIGDAVMLAGPDPDALLASMTDLVTACLVEPDMPLPRAGPHTGTAVARGNDFFGAGVNVAARVAALAAGAHVLLTVELLTTLRHRGRP